MDNKQIITVRLDEDVFRRYEVIRATRGEKWQAVIERLSTGVIFHGAGKRRKLRRPYLIYEKRRVF